LAKMLSWSHIALKDKQSTLYTVLLRKIKCFVLPRANIFTI